MLEIWRLIKNELIRCGSWLIFWREWYVIFYEVFLSRFLSIIAICFICLIYYIVEMYPDLIILFYDSNFVSWLCRVLVRCFKGRVGFFFEEDIITRFKFIFISFGVWLDNHPYRSLIGFLLVIFLLTLLFLLWGLFVDAVVILCGRDPFDISALELELCTCYLHATVSC
jgi:hypothetical protein